MEPKWQIDKFNEPIHETITKTYSINGKFYAIKFTLNKQKEPVGCEIWQIGRVEKVLLVATGWSMEQAERWLKL